LSVFWISVLDFAPRLDPLLRYFGGASPESADQSAGEIHADFEGFSVRSDVAGIAGSLAVRMYRTACFDRRLPCLPR